MKNWLACLDFLPFKALRLFKFISAVAIITLPSHADVSYDIKVVVSHLKHGVLQPTAHSINMIATQDFSQYFPFGTNCSGAISVGQVCNLSYFSSNNPVRVESIDFNSFTLISLPGHAEGANRRITFRFENAYDRIYMYVHATGPSSWPSWATKHGMVAKDTWNFYGTKLKNGVDSGAWRQYGGQL